MTSYKFNYCNLFLVLKKFKKIESDNQKIAGQHIFRISRLAREKHKKKSYAAHASKLHDL
jgi:hypothetical protein